MDTPEIDRLLAECEREPIHTPGAIQPHGVLLACDSADGVIRFVSANVGERLGREPEEVLGRRLEELLGAEPAARIARAAEQRSFLNPARIPAMPTRPELAAEAIVHMHAGRLIVEIEFLGSEGAAESPIDLYLSILATPVASASSAATVEEYLRDIVRGYREQTNFDRVMVYRFREDLSGEVVAESRAEDMEEYLGLRYPASDIPAQARELYRLNMLRMIPDASYKAVPVLADADADADVEAARLDMSLCQLRAVSPVHLEYLRNMGVRASLTASILLEGKLWGLIACHHREPKQVSYAMRASSILFATVVGSHISTIQIARQAEVAANARRVLQGFVESMSLIRGLEQGFAEALPGIAEVLGAEGATVRLDEHRVRHGLTPGEDVETLLLDKLDAAGEGGTLMTDSISRFLWGASAESEVAGAMGVVLAPEIELLLWRAEEETHVRWGGRPDRAVSRAESGPLRPRASFEVWTEERRGCSRPWEAGDLAAIRDFRASFSSLLVRQNEELERINRELQSKNEEMESFVYSVSHDLKSPVVTMQSFVGLLREDIAAGDKEAIADSLDRIDRSASRLSKIIEEMLELSRIGHAAGEQRPIDLGQLFDSLGADLRDRLARRAIRLDVHPDLPVIYGDPMSIERMFENLLVNAEKHGCPRDGMEIRVRASTTRKEVIVRVEDDGDGIAPEHHQRVFNLFQRMNPTKSGTGIGLALVAKTAQVHQGRAWVESDTGKGAAFCVALPKNRG